MEVGITGPGQGGELDSEGMGWGDNRTWEWGELDQGGREAG